MTAIALAAITGAFSISGGVSTYAAGACGSNTNLFGLPHWYDNLPTSEGSTPGSCSIIIKDPTQLWTIVTNIINIILHLTGLVAVIFIILGGIRYITSQGESAGITAAKQTITRAIIGLIISIVAVLIVTYISNTVFGQHVDANGNYEISPGNTTSKGNAN